MSLPGAKVTGRSVAGVWIDDFGFEPQPKHISTLSGYRGKDKVHFANPIMYNGDELHQMVMWCIDTFGKPGECDLNTMTRKWDYQQSPDYFFWFYDEKYLMMFILRWS